MGCIDEDQPDLADLMESLAEEQEGSGDPEEIDDAAVLASTRRLRVNSKKALAGASAGWHRWILETRDYPDELDDEPDEWGGLARNVELDFDEVGLSTSKKWDTYADLMRRELTDVPGSNLSHWREVHVFVSESERVAYHNKRDRLGGDLLDEEWDGLRRAFDYRCAYCGVKKKKLQLEHIRPLSLGGRTSIDNVLPACKDCNFSKGTRSLEEWLGGDSWWLEFIGRLVVAAERYEPPAGTKG